MPGMSKPYRVIVTETAWEMLIAQSRFLASVSMSAASRLIDGFVEATDTLVALPERNPWLEHDAIPFQKYRKMLFGKHYPALYQIEENTVYITAVVDCRQDYVWLF